MVYPPARNLFDILVRRWQEDAMEAKLARAWVTGGMLRIMPQLDRRPAARS
jgi:hypothetical protein